MISNFSKFGCDWQIVDIRLRLPKASVHLTDHNKQTRDLPHLLGFQQEQLHENLKSTQPVDLESILPSCRNNVIFGYMSKCSCKRMENNYVRPTWYMIQNDGS